MQRREWVSETEESVREMNIGLFTWTGNIISVHTNENMEASVSIKKKFCPQKSESFRSSFIKNRDP